MIIVLWGVSGCGKSTVGELLAAELNCQFYDADDFHPAANIEKMRAGIPLSDDDRWPWLASIASTLEDNLARSKTAVLACSALRQAYRDVLNVDPEMVRFVQLAGSFALISERLAQRQHEFMNASLLQSQFDTLELSDEGLVADVALPPGQMCQYIIKALALK